MAKKETICAITMGDPAGIGPEIIIKALRDRRLLNKARYLIVGTPEVFEKTARRCGVGLPVKDKRVSFLSVGGIDALKFGLASRQYGRVALRCIDQALDLLKDKKVDALVTAPVNKHTIALSQKEFTGHTEYLAAAANGAKVVMMLVGGGLRVALVTRHIAVKDVARKLRREDVYDTIVITAKSLKKYFGIARPRIAICGLNPHAGDSGLIGKEEGTVIAPAIKRAGFCARISGPYPADTVFYSVRQGEFDAVVAMYHDQGLAPLKMLALHEGVNITLGLPFVRTSPDHGTAYNIAGRNQADPGSMKQAIALAIDMSVLGKRGSR